MNEEYDNEEYDKENGGPMEVSEEKRSRWHISSDVRNLLAVFVAALALLGAVWGVCDHALSKLDARFDEIDAEFDKIDGRFDRQDSRMDGIESAMAEGFRQTREAMAEGFRQTREATAEGFRQTHDHIDRTDARIDRLDARVDRLETKVDGIDAFLRQGGPQLPVGGGDSNPAPVAKPEGSSRDSSWPLSRDR